MNDSSQAVTIDFRIPGRWVHPRELFEALPAGCRITGEELILADGARVEFGAAEADDQFAQIFRTSCRDMPTPDELAAVQDYTVNIFLSGPGGSLDAARIMMRAAAAIIQAGGAGVFIDNCILAHGGQNWLNMTEDGSIDAVSFAFVGIIRGGPDVYTMGMHALGLPEIVMKEADIEKRGLDIVEVIRYVSGSERQVENGHVIADLDGPCYRVIAEASDKSERRGAMYNPFGRLRLVSLREIAETN